MNDWLDHTNKQPAQALLAALFFGALRSGGSTMELFTRIPRDLIDILQALIILFVAIELSLTWLRHRRKNVKTRLEAAQG